MSTQGDNICKALRIVLTYIKYSIILTIIVVVVVVVFKVVFFWKQERILLLDHMPWLWAQKRCYQACRHYEAFVSVFEKNPHFTAWRLRRHSYCAPGLSQHHSLKKLQPGLAHLLHEKQRNIGWGKTSHWWCFVFILTEKFLSKNGFSAFYFEKNHP